MRNLTDLKEGVEAASQNLSELDNKHSESNEYIRRMTNEAEDRVHQIQEEMMLSRTENERIIGEYRNAKHLLHQLEMLNLNASSRNYPLAPDYDLANAPTVTPSLLTDTALLNDPDDDYAEVDREQVRLGFQHVLNKKGNGVSN